MHMADAGVKHPSIMQHYAARRRQLHDGLQHSRNLRRKPLCHCGFLLTVQHRENEAFFLR